MTASGAGARGGAGRAGSEGPALATPRIVAGERLSGTALLDALEAGTVRVATFDGLDARGERTWKVHAWVKEELLAIFRESPVAPMRNETACEFTPTPAGVPYPFRDKAPLTVQRFPAEAGVRVVPGGTAIRRGACLRPGVVCMPPCYVNVGAWVGEDTMIDSHALVGSCAQVGARVHLSAAAQLGGVLEPPLARPVIIEDDVFVGGGCGVYEGVRVRAGAVLAAGVILTASTRVYDLVHETELGGTRAAPLEIPERAVVVPGSSALDGAFARARGLAQRCALIVKYRDERTDAATALEGALR